MRKNWLLVSLGFSCLLVGAAGPALAEKIGKVAQGLVAGTEVSAQEQEDQGLVSISSGGSCSGALLNSEWVLSAAHCFEGVKASQVTITANWSKKQTRKGRELYLLAKDIAIVRVATPFDGVAVDFNMPIYTGNVGPGRAIKVYGRGIYMLATGEGDSAIPAQRDGKYRTADFQVSHTDADHFWFGPGKGGAIPAGGDSGGPAFISAGNRWFLAGVSSECATEQIKGKPDEGWDWVSKIDECGYAPVASVWPDIQRRIGTPACRAYAWRAVGTVQLTKYYKCDPKVVSGPRWSPNFDDHLGWCMGGAKAADMNAEDQARATIAQECRIAAAMPQGTSALTVAMTADGFALSGSGYAVNSRVIIRITGAAALQKNITSNFSDPSGHFAATLAMADVCAGPGPITFTAEDQDKPASPPVNATCSAVAAAEPQPPPAAEQPPKQPSKKFVTVQLAVDLYEAPGGNGQATGTLEAGTKQVALVEPCADNWCHVQWPQGEGWVYSGPDYQSLRLP